MFLRFSYLIYLFKIFYDRIIFSLNMSSCKIDAVLQSGEIGYFFVALKTGLQSMLI